jgi:hypothetical protein
VKQERAETLEKMANLTEGEKQQFRRRVRDRAGGTGSRSEAVRERLAAEWENMSEEEKQAYKARMEAALRARRQRRLEEAAGGLQTAAQVDPNAERMASEPNEGNPN